MSAFKTYLYRQSPPLQAFIIATLATLVVFLMPAVLALFLDPAEVLGLLVLALFLDPAEVLGLLVLAPLLALLVGAAYSLIVWLVC